MLLIIPRGCAKFTFCLTVVSFKYVGVCILFIRYFFHIMNLFYLANQLVYFEAYFNKMIGNFIQYQVYNYRATLGGALWHSSIRVVVDPEARLFS